MPWGISENANDIEKLKAEFNDYIMGLNSCGKIDYITYSDLYDKGMELLDKMYELGKAEVKEDGK